ncbi:MAG: hypothetical protein JNK45_13540 [Myxococcales bacterium]|nr:hypothetical protein [Myxococcales bacterium]
MTDPYAALLAEIQRAVLEAPAHTPIERRRAAAARTETDPLLARYLGRVHDEASSIGDTDVAALKSAGHDEETLFELTVAAAVGAASHRCARALAALEACEAEGDLRSEP